MKIPRLGLLTATLLTLLGLCPLLPAADSTLVNFANYTRDPNGRTTNPYEYAYGDWNKHLSAYKSLGTLIKAPSGKGGMGDNHADLDLAKLTAVELVLVVGNGNKASNLSFFLEDKDGTGYAWNLPLEGKPRGQEVRFRFELGKPDYVQTPGKTAGLNQKKIAVWQLRGDQTAPYVEVLALKVVPAQ